jgi:FKBP12-rapamycin complex-associated protein
VTDSSGGYVIEAIKGFSRSLTLSHDQPIVNVLQDTLRLLTLWFTYGSAEEVFEVLTSEIEKVSADNWIGVLPQMIARLVVLHLFPSSESNIQHLTTY